MTVGNRSNITIYIPPSLKAELQMLPPRSISKVCQRALQGAVDGVKRQRIEVITEAFEED